MKQTGGIGVLRGGIVALLSIVLASCASSSWSRSEFEASRQALSDHIRVLASEEFGGREPGTEGGRLTQQYIVDKLKSYGFSPGGPGGEWRQNVGLVRYTPGQAVLSMTGKRGRFSLSGEGLLMQNSGPRVRLEDRGAVFVSSDQGLEEGSLTGQIALVQPDGYAEFTSELRDAEPAVIVALVEDEADYADLEQRMRRGRFGLLGAEPTRTAVAIIPPALTEEFSARIGKSLDQLNEEAAETGGPLLLDDEASLTADLVGENRETANVIGMLPGKVRGSGVVFLMAHWDHLGICRESDPVDRLCNGAIDNASGVGMMLEVARRIAAEGPLDRDLYVVGLTSEELGLLGAKVFADDPPVPLPTVVAAFNLDSMALAPRGSPITVVGDGLTSLDPGIRDIAKRLKRRMDIREEHQGFVQRQDGWVLLSKDVPTVVVTSSMANTQNFESFLRDRYHKPGDEWRPDLELGGATEDILLHVELLRHFGNEATYSLGG